MKFLLTVSILLLSLTSTVAQTWKASASQFQTKRGRHTARVVFRVRAFDPTKHTVAFGNFENRVDGRVAYGAEGVPRVEIASLALYFDARAVVVPRKLYEDCYDPNLKEGYLALKLSEDGRSLLMFMAGSDAAGSYQVLWVLRRDGRHSRFVNNCSDCDYSGMLNFLEAR